MPQIERIYLFYDFDLLVTWQWLFGQFISYYTCLLHKSDIAAVTELRKNITLINFL